MLRVISSFASASQGPLLAVNLKVKDSDMKKYASSRTTWYVSGWVSSSGTSRPPNYSPKRIPHDLAVNQRHGDFTKAIVMAEQKHVFDENSVENNMFPWLTEKFLSRTRFRAFTKEGDGDLCRAKSIYKFLAAFKSTEISQIYFAIMKEVNKYCNVKVYKFRGKEEHLLAVKEAMVLDFVRDCPFVVHLIENFKTMGGHYLVTENFGFTTLHNLLKDTMFFTDYEVKFYASELVSAIQFLHKEGIIHRTLSTHTVGIKSSGHIKLFDLERSFCSLREDGSADPDPQTIGMFGLKAYMSPEMINYDKYNNKVDWWCLGVILYTLAHGKMPFQGQGRRGLMTAILEKDVAFDSGIHDELTISFITKSGIRNGCVKFQLDPRLCMGEIMCTNFLPDKLLIKDPKERLGDGEVKTHAFFEDIQWEKVEALGYDPPFPCPANAMHNMPADLCSSQTFIPKCDSVTEIIDDTMNMAKKYARQVSLYPMRQYDCELTSDWAAFMASPNLITSGIAYVKNYLQVPPPEPGRPLFIEDYTVVCPLRPAADPENPEKLSSKAPSEDDDDYTLTDASMTDRDTENEHDSGKKMSATRSSLFRRAFYKEEEDDQSFKDLDPFLYDGDDGSTVVTQNTRLGGLIRQMEHNSKKDKLQKQNFRTTNQARTLMSFRTESYHYE